MATTITNQASLTYAYNGSTGSAKSNIAIATLTDALSATKTALNTTYQAGDTITYILSFTNEENTALSGITLVDNLGTYVVGTENVTPLTFVAPAILYINGVSQGNISPTVAANSITFDLASLAANAVAQIIYTVKVNDNALLTTDSTIENTVIISADGLTEDVTASATVTVDDYADVEITKCMSPASVTDGSTITYTFTLYNYGNTEATDVVLTDAFDPAPSNISVTVDGTAVSSSDYTYTSGTLTLPTGDDYSITIPAATYSQDSTTGEVTVTPSTTTVVVTGTL